MATLTGRTIASSYTELLKTTSASGVTGSLDTVQDGDATDSALQISTAGVKSTGTLAATGITTLSADLRLEDDAGGEYVGIGTPSAVTSYTVTLPAAVGSSGQALRTSDSSGTLEWFTPEVGDITAVTAGTNLNGGGSSGDVTLNLDTTITGLTSVTSTAFVGDLTGNVTATSALADGVTATTQSSGDNSTKVATTAYVDSQVTAEDLDFQGDSGTGSVDLDSQSLDVAGGTNITTAASSQTLTVNLDSTLTGLSSVTSTNFVGDITGDVTGDVTGNVSGTAATVTGATQAAITSAANLATVGTIGTGVWQGTAIDGAYVDIEGTEIKSTGESGGTKFLREDGDGTCSWQTVAGDIEGITAGNGLTGGGTSGTVTINAAGTSNRISVSADAIDIDAAYVGQTSITTLGTIATGTWNGTAIDGAYVDIEGTEIKSTGESGGSKFLREDGDGTCSWQTVTADPAGSNSQIQFNNSGSFGADSNLVWDSTNEKLGVGTSVAINKVHAHTGDSGVVYSQWSNSTTGQTSTDGLIIGLNADEEAVIMQQENDALKIGTNGAERFRIAANGSWGLAGANYGTSSQVLTSNGSGSAPTWQDASGGGGDVSKVGTPASGQVGYWTGDGTLAGENDLFWDATNNRLGIVQSSPSYELDVTGSVNSTTAYNLASNEIIDYESLGGGEYKLRLGQNTGTTLNYTGLFARGTEVVTLDGANARVGIGTTAPAKKFHCVGEARFDGTSGAANVSINSGAADSDSYLWFLENGTSKASVFHDASADALVLTDGANSATAYIKSDRIGIGTATPAKTMHVATAGTNGQLRLQNTDGQSWDFYSYNDNNLYINDAGGTVLTLTDAGRAGIGTTAPNAKLTVSDSSSSTSAANHEAGIRISNTNTTTNKQC